MVSPKLKKNPVNHLSSTPAGTQYKYGIAIEHIGFTPNNIKSPEIQIGDRPFAAAIMLKSFAIATDTLRKSRLISALSIGIIGPGAFGQEMQSEIHRATGNDIPQGWQNQIKNDVVLNYEIGYEKQLLRDRRLISLQANGAVKVGTLFTNASVGFTAIFGIVNSPFSNINKKSRLQMYFYSQPLVSVIGYDATLQGGLFNGKSPYKITSKAVERFTAQHNFGVIVQIKALYFEYSRANTTRQFETGRSYGWGGVKVGFKF